MKQINTCCIINTEQALVTFFLEKRKMNIFISYTLKELRKNHGNTQEELAAHVGVSDQAVSKWERGESFPDITLLPAIAFYYNVSVDDLLGVGKIQVEKKINEYLDKSDALQKIGDTESNLKLWTEALKEFPNNPIVLGGYMSVIGEENTDECIEIAERLIKESGLQSDVPYGAIDTLFNVYNRLGDEEKAIKYAQMLPRAEISRDHRLTQIYKGAKLVESVMENLRELVQLIDDQIYRMVWHGDLNRDEQRKARLCCLKLYEWLYEDGDYGYYYTRVSNIYADLAIFDAWDNNIDGVINNLSHMADCEINFLTQKYVKRTSFLVNRTYQGHTGYPNSTENACRWAVNFMYRDWFVFCREDERFKEIEEKLAVYAN